MVDENKLQWFEGFEVNILEDTEHCFIIECRNPNSSTHRFVVTSVPTANLITVTGDLMPCIMLHPGYGRGIGWLAGSYKSGHYFIEKMNLNIEKGITKFCEEQAKQEIEEYLKDHYGYDPDAENPWEETEEEKLNDMPKPLRCFYETKDRTTLYTADDAYRWLSEELVNDWVESGDFGTTTDYSGVEAGLHYLFNHPTMVEYFKS